MIFDDASIDSLRDLVRGRMSEKRYLHTLGVENMAKRLGEILLPDKVSELTVAALLHDVAKELSYDEHLELLRGGEVEFTEEDLSVKPALHSIAGVPLILRDFSYFATSDVCSAVFNHTVGAPEMSVFDEIIFISDYAEEGRTYRTCIEVREYLLADIKKENSEEDNLSVLHTASLKSIEATVQSLKHRGERINTRTLRTKKYFDDILK